MYYFCVFCVSVALELERKESVKGRIRAWEAWPEYSYSVFVLECIRIPYGMCSFSYSNNY